ncbi:hypothetical protein [Paraburkholderia diazotrophica]|uniref:hypothetical protein n=1 Tax=Paraburkholderia diazotrophica TaxID=667676 RepID=UPI00115FC10E|nr:hypothetical protein [Paraburkholderia diazotrophica]
MTLHQHRHRHRHACVTRLFTGNALALDAPCENAIHRAFEIRNAAFSLALPRFNKCAQYGRLPIGSSAGKNARDLKQIF